MLLWSFQGSGPYRNSGYKLLFLEGSHIHHVFHCSLLKPFLHDAANEPRPLPLSGKDMENHLVITPLTILSMRWEGPKDALCLQVLVQWAGLHVDYTSWEDWVFLKEDYHLKDKVVFDGSGSDRPSKMQEAQNERSKRKSSSMFPRLRLVIGVAGT